MRRNNDKMLLESLVRKYGKNSVKNAINEMNNHNNAFIKNLPVFFEDEDDKNELLDYFEENGIKVICKPGDFGEYICSFICSTRNSKLVLVDFLVRFYYDGDIKQFKHELLPDYPYISAYIDASDGAFKLYD